MAPNPINLYGLVIHGPKPYKFIRFGDIHGPNPCKFTGFGRVAARCAPNVPWTELMGTLLPMIRISEHGGCMCPIGASMRHMGVIWEEVFFLIFFLFRILVSFRPKLGPGACPTAPASEMLQKSTNITCKFTRFGDIHGPKPYKFIRFGDPWPQTL